MQSQHKAYLHILYFFWAENPSLVSFIWYICIYNIHICIFGCLYVHIYLSVRLSLWDPAICLFISPGFTCHVLSPSCQWGFIARWRTHLSGPCSKVFCLAKRPHHLTTHLILNRLGRLGDPSEYPLQCSPYFHRATPVTRPSSWCVCPVVVLSWLDNVFVCLSSPNSSPPLAETWKISRVTEEISIEAAVELEHLPHYQLSFEVQHLHPWEGHLGHLCCWLSSG